MYSAGMASPKRNKRYNTYITLEGVKIGARIILTKKSSLLLATGLVLEVVAIWFGSVAGNALANEPSRCFGSPVTQKMSWLLAITGIIFAIISLRTSIKQKNTGLIISGVLGMIMCCILALASWFLSIFCITF
jgi:succinate dehydrogenase hydrophobic anchor subunit